MTQFELDYDKITVDYYPDETIIGGYSFIKIGEIDNHPLYLCKYVIFTMEYSTHYLSWFGRYDNDWKNANVREWLNTKFYNNYLSQDDREHLEPYNGDNIFLLSKEEYNLFREKTRMDGRDRHDWWLRSPGDEETCALFISYQETICNSFVQDKTHGVRPALLLN